MKPRKESVKSVKRRLDAMDKRHPFRIGDKLPPGDVLLKIVRAGISRTLDASALEQTTLTARQIGEGEASSIAMEFSAWLAGEQVDVPVVRTYRLPATRLDYLKYFLCGEITFSRWSNWLWRWFTPTFEWKKVEAAVTAEVVYPYLKLPKALPECQAVLVRVRGEGEQREVVTAGL